MKQQEGEKLRKQRRNESLKGKFTFIKEIIRKGAPPTLHCERERTDIRTESYQTKSTLNLRNKRHPCLVQFPWSPHHDYPATHTRKHTHANTHTHAHTHTSLSLSTAEMVSKLVNDSLSGSLLMFTGYLPHRHEVGILINCVSPVDLSFITMQLSQELRRVEGKLYFLF